jgi:hypothetical protein
MRVMQVDIKNVNLPYINHFDISLLSLICPASSFFKAMLGSIFN